MIYPFPKFDQVIQAETKRLILRQWKESDYEAFADLNADPSVMEYFPETWERKRSIDRAKALRQLIDENGWGFWAVEEKVSNRFIGFVGLNEPTYELPFAPCVEIGWRLLSDYWGKGYATEAALKAMEIGFQTLKLEEIVSFTALINKRSIRVMEKLGMTCQPTTFEHPNVEEGSPLRTHCWYLLTKSEWEK